jgi:5-methylcytosine-specific restriction endonuclease McrA
MVATDGQVRSGLTDKASGIESVLSDLAAGHFDQARQRLHGVWPYVQVNSSSRRSLPRSLQVRVFMRDKFYCRYCGTRTVFLGALQLLSTVYPQDFPCHPNWKRSATHPAFLELAASCDHVKPIARGGSDEEANLVTTCSKCNYIKGDWLIDELRWKIIDTPLEPWDGCLELFAKIVDICKIQDRSLVAWRKLLKGKVSAA